MDLAATSRRSRRRTARAGPARGRTEGRTCSAPTPKSISPTSIGRHALDVVQTYTLSLPTRPGWPRARQTAGPGARQSGGGGAPQRRSPDAPRSVVARRLHPGADLRGVGRAGVSCAADEAAKKSWFGGRRGPVQPIERFMDFRIGGSERLRGAGTTGRHRPSTRSTTTSSPTSASSTATPCSSTR